MFKSIFDSEINGESIDKMIDWIKEVSKILLSEYKNVLLFNTLTGLRSDETQKVIYLIKTRREKEYVDKDKWVLKHYLFLEKFLRQTKNAYFSIINEYILKIAKNTPNRENYYNSLRKRISITNNFDMNMYYCRKIFATFLRSKAIESELIDLLQGRNSNSLFSLFCSVNNFNFCLSGLVFLDVIINVASIGDCKEGINILFLYIRGPPFLVGAISFGILSTFG